MIYYPPHHVVLNWYRFKSIFVLDTDFIYKAIFTVINPKFGPNHRKVALCNFWFNYTVYYKKSFFYYKSLILMEF